jgi:2-amino-4-hydroxy-6-hydroxymethyldihydropteridine diphosphokinase
MNQVVFILGGNLGDKLRLIEAGAASLVMEFGPIVFKSSIYETAAWGGNSEGNYLNQVLVFKTTISPEAVLEIILAIEISLGRKRSEKWGDRTMDIDILYFGNEIINTDRLNIPHPYIQDRRFVLEPLAEILPDYVHPVLNLTSKELLAQCLDNSTVIKIK